MPKSREVGASTKPALTEKGTNAKIRRYDARKVPWAPFHPQADVSNVRKVGRAESRPRAAPSASKANTAWKAMMEVCASLVR